MAELNADAIQTLLSLYVIDSKLDIDFSAFAAYLALLLKWNEKINLTAIRAPEEIVQRHFGESLFAASCLPASATTILDFGSGGGFPGIPIQIARPDSRVTLAESQTRKAAFLQEAVRTLGLGAEVWPKRVEEMPTERTFSVVVMRAVDKMGQALPEAMKRVQSGGSLLLLSTSGDEAKIKESLPQIEWAASKAIPLTEQGIVLLGTKGST